MRTTVLLATLALGGLSGCAPITQCGDAWVTRPKQNFLRDLTALGMLREGYAVTLPAVDLSRAGVTEFHVDHLPVGKYDFDMRLTGILPGDRSSSASPALPVGVGETVVSIRAATYDGGILFNADLNLRDLRLGLFHSSVTSSVLPAAGNAVNFRVIVTVIHPFPTSDVKLFLEGFAPDPVGPITFKTVPVER